MENPDTWDELDQAVADLLTRYYLNQDAGVVGLSLVRTVADFVRERERSRNESTMVALPRVR